MVGMLSLLMPAPATTPDRGDSRAFGAATAELGPHVRAVVAAVLGVGRDHPDVDDCAHEALRRAIEGRKRLRDGEPLRPWVTGIARHVALDALRARRRQRERIATARPDEDGNVPDLVENVPDAGPTPFERMADAERREVVTKAVASLPEGQRKALTLFHMEGLQYQEIAVRLGVPLGTVATWVTRARARLAETLGATAEES
jgi:RNA polymerase sigma-70 factor, ECF subfamily